MTLPSSHCPLSAAGQPCPCAIPDEDPADSCHGSDYIFHVHLCLTPSSPITLLAIVAVAAG